MAHKVVVGAAVVGGMFYAALQAKNDYEIQREAKAELEWQVRHSYPRPPLHSYPQC